ncbi:cyclin-D3-2-like [Zingiber officinale]|uniref:cyclin-D3-2-like n=1 Tax=Zingiber officinale TaxID=94328 RepID=UPI001C4B6017|nr:cyclin-D3-2-like [Zingiber officinale]
MALVSLFDHLDCEEENLELEEEQRELLADLPLPAAEAEVEWEQFRCSLEAKEMEFLPKPCPDGGGGFYLRSARMETVEWVVHGAAQHGFSALTALLAVNYLDRCFLPCSARGELLRLQDDKPWMGRLAAVACLSLAAKVEETRVPLLLDLQLFPEPPEDGGFVFEPKTIRRMELLVLSALGWRTNPVTPLSFIHHLLPRLFSKAKTAEADFAGSDITYRVSALTSRCEAALLSVIADQRWVRYPASVWAAAALLDATEAGDHHRLSLNAPKEKVEECYRLILERTPTAMIHHKRKRSSVPCFCSSPPPSPSGVIGSCFSCDSWAPPPPYKRNNGGTSK